MRLKKMVAIGRLVISTCERVCSIEIEEEGLMPKWVVLLTQPL
jgi:non-homologous end joining protein Ku